MVVSNKETLSLEELSIEDLTELQTPKFLVKCTASEVIPGYLFGSEDSRTDVKDFDQVIIPFNGLTSDFVPLFNPQQYRDKNTLVIQFSASAACQFNNHVGMKKTGRCMDVILATKDKRGSVLKVVNRQVEMYDLSRVENFYMEIPAFNLKGSDDEEALKNDFYTVSTEDAEKNVYKVKCI